jgi:CRISPR-associated protein Csb2
MALAIGVSFLTGRFHATPWAHHVNEGKPEWPPSPWRFIRTLVATWKKKLNSHSLVNEMLPSVIEKLVSPPLFKLPPTTASHTRHYMPWHKNWSGEEGTKRTQVFDTFIALQPHDEVIFCWPETELTRNELNAMNVVLSHVNYFGRAESWAEFRVVHPPRKEDINCAPVESYDSRGPEDSEPVSVICPDLRTWNDWSYSGKANKPNPPWNILAETFDLHKDKWSWPPGSGDVTYVRRRDALASRPRIIRAEAVRPTIVRYSLDGAVLPLVTETVYVAEIARRRIQGIFGRFFEGQSSRVLSGKSDAGQPLQGHVHTFYLPTDEDGDMRIDHLTVVAQDGFDPVRELRVLDRFNRMHVPGGKPEVSLLLVGTGTFNEMENVPIISQAHKWRSVTPFVPPRHFKKRGRRRDTCSPEEFPAVVLREELARLGLPRPVNILSLRRCELWDHSKRRRALSRVSVPWLEFRRERVFGHGSRGFHPGCGFEIEFPEPVRGPLALGYGCHFGLGLFAPMN